MFRKLFFFLITVFLLLFNGQAYCQTSFAILPMEVRDDVKPEKVEGAIKDIVIVNLGENQGLKAGDRLFVARKEALRGDTLSGIQAHRHFRNYHCG